MYPNIHGILFATCYSLPHGKHKYCVTINKIVIWRVIFTCKCLFDEFNKTNKNETNLLLNNFHMENKSDKAHKKH